LVQTEYNTTRSDDTTMIQRWYEVGTKFCKLVRVWYPQKPCFLFDRQTCHRCSFRFSEEASILVQQGDMSCPMSATKSMLSCSRRGPVLCATRGHGFCSTTRTIFWVDRRQCRIVQHEDIWYCSVTCNVVFSNTHTCGTVR